MVDGNPPPPTYMLKFSRCFAPKLLSSSSGLVVPCKRQHLGRRGVISPHSGPRARAVSCPMCSDLMQTLRTLASDLLYPALPRSPCSQAPTEPLDPLGRMDEEVDPEGTPGPSSAGAPHARSTISCVANHACTPPSCTAAPSLPERPRRPRPDDLLLPLSQPSPSLAAIPPPSPPRPSSPPLPPSPLSPPSPPLSPAPSSPSLLCCCRCARARPHDSYTRTRVLPLDSPPPLPSAFLCRAGAAGAAAVAGSGASSWAGSVASSWAGSGASSSTAETHAASATAPVAAPTAAEVAAWCAANQVH